MSLDCTECLGHRWRAGSSVAIVRRRQVPASAGRGCRADGKEAVTEMAVRRNGPSNAAGSYLRSLSITVMSPLRSSTAPSIAETSQELSSCGRPPPGPLADVADQRGVDGSTANSIQTGAWSLGLSRPRCSTAASTPTADCRKLRWWRSADGQIIACEQRLLLSTPQRSDST
jgi:hypothetical protein